MQFDRTELYTTWLTTLLSTLVLSSLQYDLTTGECKKRRKLRNGLNVRKKQKWSGTCWEEKVPLMQMELWNCRRKEVVYFSNLFGCVAVHTSTGNSLFSSRVRVHHLHKFQVLVFFVSTVIKFQRDESRSSCTLPGTGKINKTFLHFIKSYEIVFKVYQQKINSLLVTKRGVRKERKRKNTEVASFVTFVKYKYWNLFENKKLFQFW